MTKFIQSVYMSSMAISLIGLSSMAFAARPELKASEQVEIAASPEKVWAVIEHFEDLGWHPAVATTALITGKPDQAGAIRLIITKGGAKITDELLKQDGKAHSVTYKIVDSTLPVDQYQGTLQVLPNKTGSILKWSSTFTRKSEKSEEGADDATAIKTITGIYTSGINAVKARLESGQ